MPGPQPNYTLAQVLFIVTILAKEKTGRKQLCTKLSCGEGTIRTILKMLKSHELILSSNSGTTLSEKGFNLFKEMQQYYSGPFEINAKELTVGTKDSFVIVKKFNKNNINPLFIRDKAIIEGALGITTITHKHIKDKTFEQNQDMVKKLFSTYKVKESEIVLIGTGDSLDRAHTGVFAGLLHILPSSFPFFSIVE